jgi:glyoxylase-like metal-dependent hydrolase (beta-lactamase superfamily II)
LTEVAGGTWAYVADVGGWGWSNAGLVVDGEATLLVDTLFDRPLTEAMLATMRGAVPAAVSIDTIVNTHANGDHCYGNRAAGAREIITSSRSAVEMDEVPPALLAGFVAAAPDLGATGQYLVDIFGGFDFEGTEPEAPTRTFDGSLTLDVGDREVVLLELGPAHTSGDVAVHVPDAGVVYTGDLVFHGGHPIVWAGPVANWMAACDRLLALDAEVVVPGHGPVGDRRAVEDQRGYFEWLVAEGTPRLTGGLSPLDAALDLAGGPYDGWGEAERLVANLIALGRDLGLEPADDVITVFDSMASLREQRR